MTITSEMWLYLAIGFGAGFLLEFLLDLIFFRPRTRRLAAEVSRKTDDLNTRNKELAETRSNLQTANTSLSLARTNLETADDRIATLRASLSEAETALALREQTLNTLETDQQNLYRRLQTAIGRSGQLEQQLHTQSEKAHTLHTQLEQAHIEIRDLESRMHVPGDVWDRLNGRIAQLKTQLAQSETERQNLATRLQTAVGQAGQANLLLRDAQTKIDALNARLAQTAVEQTEHSEA